MKRTDRYDIAREDGYEAGFVAGYRACLQDITKAVIHGTGIEDALGDALRKIDRIEEESESGKP